MSPAYFFVVLMRYFLYFSYNGYAYHGIQYQPNGITVQEVLENCLSTLGRERVQIVPAGRTDAGVHARLMVAHFDVSQPIDEQQWTFRLNALLPHDIAVSAIRRVRDDAHARFDAVARRYEYWMTTRKNPFTEHLVTETHFALDYEAMNKAATYLLEATDFASFCKAHADNKTNICHLTKAEWVRVDECTYKFVIEADRFLRNMVRAVVGTLVQVGRGRMKPEDMPRVLEDKSRSSAGQSMPPDGLYLVDIRYPEEIFA